MGARTATAHERVYQQLRERILFGGIQPGRPVTLRGLADELQVSPMPVRESVRRLIAEGALDMHDNRRVSVPDMTREKFAEIIFARNALEPELAVRALPRFAARSSQTATIPRYGPAVGFPIPQRCSRPRPGRHRSGGARSAVRSWWGGR